MIHDDLMRASPVLLWWFKAKRDYGGVQRHDLQLKDKTRLHGHHHRFAFVLRSRLPGRETKGKVFGLWTTSTKNVFVPLNLKQKMVSVVRKVWVHQGVFSAALPTLTPHSGDLSRASHPDSLL